MMFQVKLAMAAISLAAFGGMPGARGQTVSSGATAQAVALSAPVSRIQVGGRLDITAAITANQQIPNGALVTYNGSASVYDGSYSNSHQISGSATVSNGKVSVVLSIPYIWLVSSLTDKMTVSLFFSSRVSTAGPNYNFTSNFGSSMTVPKDGAVTKLNLTGTL